MSIPLKMMNVDAKANKLDIGIDISLGARECPRFLYDPDRDIHIDKINLFCSETLGNVGVKHINMGTSTGTYTSSHGEYTFATGMTYGSTASISLTSSTLAKGTPFKVGWETAAVAGQVLMEVVWYFKDGNPLRKDY